METNQMSITKTNTTKNTSKAADIAARAATVREKVKAAAKAKVTAPLAASKDERNGEFLMNHVVNFSGGAGSFATALHLKQQGLSPTLLFCDTKMEDEDLYRYMQDASRVLEIPITIIADGRDPWQVFFDTRYLGNSRIDPCSRILKRDLAKKYIRSTYSSEDTILYFGIDWMETHRLAKIKQYWAPYEVRSPLALDLSWDKSIFLQKCEEDYNLKRPRLYEMGFPHNNCGGFCVKAGKAHFLNLLEKLPERYAYHEAKELELQAYLGKPYTILREQVKGERVYITLKHLRERAEEIKKTEEGQHDWGGCGCFNSFDPSELAGEE
jgi:hypothetical protein